MNYQCTFQLVLSSTVTMAPTSPDRPLTALTLKIEEARGVLTDISHDWRYGVKYFCMIDLQSNRVIASSSRIEEVGTILNVIKQHLPDSAHRQWLSHLSSL